MKPIAFFRQIHTVAGPAGTLLFISVVLALVTTLARATPQTRPAGPGGPATPGVTERLTPGAALTFTVELSEPGHRLHAYLPGLDLQRVPLHFDAATRRYVGELTVPWYAPPHGRATLRVVGDGLTLEHAFFLGAAPPAPLGSAPAAPSVAPPLVLSVVDAS